MKNAEGEDILVPEGQSKIWNYHPNLPVPNSPVFRWRPRIGFVLNWFRHGWFALSGATIWVALAFVVFTWFQPSLAQWSIEGIILMLLRNLFLIFMIAGGLHLWLWAMRFQGDRLKFDIRDMMRDNGTFTFRNQVFDNMFWSIAWGVPILTLYEVIYFRAIDTGLSPTFQFNDNPIWFILFFWVILLWKGFHFYWVHRFLHWPPYYRIAHSVHHRNINTGPWSGLSMHPLETLPYFSGLLIHLIVPSHPVHFLFHAYALALNPAFSHSGFDALIVRDKRQLELGEFFHQLHHRYFECNYGTPEMPWDKWFSTYHNGTEEDTRSTRARKKRMHSG